MRPMFKPCLILAAVALLILLTAPARGMASSTLQDRTGGPRQRILVTLEADALPTPGDLSTLTMEVTPLADAPDLQVHWHLPEGVELIGEAEESLGPVAAHQTVRVVRQVRFPAGGPFKVMAQATYAPTESMRFGATGVLFFTVRNFGSEVTTRDPDARRPDAAPMPTSVERIDEAEAQRAPNGDPCFTVRGRIRRTDRPLTSAGYGPNTIVPVHDAYIELREEDTLFDDTYGEGLTDEEGRYSFSFCDDDGVFDDELELYIRLYAEVKASNGDTIAYVEDSSWIDEMYDFDSNVIESEGGTYDISSDLDNFQSEVMNINDAIFEAWTFWNESGGDHDGDDRFDYEAEVHYEPGYEEPWPYQQGSFYNGYTLDEITINGDPSNPDAWDDSVIIHEWGHQADDNYSCDDNPGGTHIIGQLTNDMELAWGEGYPDYWQSAVRQRFSDPFASWYLDFDATGTNGIVVNIEATQAATLTSPFYEMAIAGALWDLNDSTNDGSDAVNHGHRILQEVYTRDEFESNGDVFDDTCTLDSFLNAWVDLDKPTDAGTAAAVRQNVGFTFAFGLMAQAESRAPSAPNLPGSAPLQSKWWNEVVWVVDNSPSMAGERLNAVKTVLLEQASDLAAEPEGTEFALETFRNDDSGNDVVLAGQFFESEVQSGVNSLAPAAGSDPSCTVQALGALAQAIEGREDLDAWLFTDGNPATSSPTVEGLRQLLNDQEVRASVALLAPCAPVAAAAADSGAEAVEGATEADAALRSALEAYLGGGAEEPPANIVPYLLTAIQSGGQFLYADAGNVGSIADILRAQMTHSAGAGRWSDYVSDRATYRYDELATWEYNWKEAPASAAYLQTDEGPGYGAVTLPGSFNYYGSSYSSLYAYQNGYVTLGAPTGNQPNNTTIPNGAPPNNALYMYWDDLRQLIPPAVAERAPEGTFYGYVRHWQDEEGWYHVRYIGYYRGDNSGPGGPEGLIFELLLNMTTGEIRYQYDNVDNAGSATIGLENADASDAVQVSYNDLDGAESDMGYKFTPAPPQPTKTYTVVVDSTMQAVGFLLTGYSGSFDAMVVRDPDGNVVSCGSAGVLCLDLGLVQYVQANVNNRVGDWTAEIGAGPTGGGTFSFTSFATSPIAVKGLGDRSLPSVGTQPIHINLGRPVDGNQMSGFFLFPDGSIFSGGFTLYDDGLHDDYGAGDGIFGAPAFEPTNSGTAYLWVQGTVGGVEFVRSDPVPYTFHPLTVRSLGDADTNDGLGANLQFSVKNEDVHDHCYRVRTQSPEGWSPSTVSSLCLAAGESTVLNVNVLLQLKPPDFLPSGTKGDVVLSVTEVERGIITNSDSAQVTRRRPPAEIGIGSPMRYIRPDGDRAPLNVTVLDEQGFPVANGTAVELTASTGTVSPTTGYTDEGNFYAEFISGPDEGTAIITAEIAAGLTATTTIGIGWPRPQHVALRVVTDTLPADGAATTILVAIVTDRWGNPVEGQTVRLGISGDGRMGTVNGGEVITATTNVDGRARVTYTSGELAGDVYARAELLLAEGGPQRVIHEDRKRIRLVGDATRAVYLPLVRK